MRLDWVLTFLAVVDEGSFRAAAELRHISQPALSKQVQSLERELGAKLLHRGQHGTVPTPAGRSLLARARAAVGAASRFDAEAQRIADGSGGLLAVGFGVSALRLLPPIVRTFRSARPSVAVTMEDLSSSAQQQELLEGRLDIGFGRRPDASELQFEPLWRDQLAVATTERGVNSGNARNWLADQDLVGLHHARGPGLSSQVSALEQEWKMPLTPRTTTQDLFTVLALVDAGLGAAVIPLSAAPLAPASVAIVPVTATAAQWTVGAIWRTDALAPAAAHLLALARGSADPAP